tara:strand:+ start:377 stop:598 length:222 start_codon:yes stop_codon:yes gene_type:complete
MKEVKLNTATDRTKKLVELLATLEKLERDSVSDDGKLLFDSIWELLGMPTYDQIMNDKIIRKKNDGNKNRDSN